MPGTVIHRAFILAAGIGKRLRPYTDDRPKPMVALDGRPIIDHVLDRLTEAGVEQVTVNTHYMAEKLEDHLSARDDIRIVFSREAQLLDTGGGIKHALDTMGANPFFVVSGDSVWTDNDGDALALERLADAWDPAKMDMLLLLQPLDHMTLTEGRGDYDIAPDGHAIRSPGKTGGYMWTSVRLVKPEVFEGSPDGPFSFLELMDRAESRGRLYALVHDGDWHHISTPADLERVNAHLAAQRKNDDRPRHP